MGTIFMPNFRLKDLRPKRRGNLPKIPQLAEPLRAGQDSTSQSCCELRMEEATVIREGFMREEAPEWGREGSE